MVAQGIGLRVTPRDLLIFGEHGPIGNTLRFPDECGRHKRLDMVGDLALTGCEIIGHGVGHRCGHALHAELARQLKAEFEVASRLFAAATERRCA
jgi:UDP-3-O-acyl-N-acetylglucosamine deacetylase